LCSTKNTEVDNFIVKVKEAKVAIYGTIEFEKSSTSLTDSETSEPILPTLEWTSRIDPRSIKQQSKAIFRMLRHLFMCSKNTTLCNYCKSWK
jgi:hypothetical protein